MKLAKIIIYCSTLLCLTACNTRHNRATADEILYKPQFARGFSVFRSGNDTIIRITNPFQGNGTSSDEIRLSATAEQGKTIHGTAKRIICMSSSHVAFLDRLGEASRIVGISGLRFVSSPRIDKSKVKDIGYDANLNYELIASLRPDIVLMYGISGENTSITAKLTELGIPYIYIGEYTEITPLGKAEWIVPFGYMCGRAELAKAVFDSIAHRYDSLKQSIADTRRPRVMLNAPYQDVWFVPSDSSYMATLLRDAGAEYICSGDTSHISRPLNIEIAYRKASEADFWINTNEYRTTAELRAANPRFGDTPAVRSGHVYNCVKRTNAAGGSDFWESGVVNADLVLRDLIRIFHGSKTDTSLYYYMQLR